MCKHYCIHSHPNSRKECSSHISAKTMNITTTHTTLMPTQTDSSTADEQLAAWVRRMALGDEAALGFLYDATLSKVYSLALKITGNRAWAQDVTTEIYWQAWREAVRFDAQRGVAMAWLLMMTRSRALDLMRKQDDAISHPEPTLLVTEHATDTNPLSDLLTNENNSALKSAITTLSPIQRQMIALAFYKDLSHQEISDATGLPLGTVKSHLRRAQDTLKTSLSKQ